MRIIKRELWAQPKKSAKGQDYLLYCYQLDDGQEVETVTQFEEGTPVEVWYDEQWDKVKMRRGNDS